MGRKRKITKSVETKEEVESFLRREADFENSDIIKEIKEEVKDEFPDLKVKIRLSKRQNEPDNIVFRFDDALPEKDIQDKIKAICKDHQQLHYRTTKYYSQWEANFRIIFKVRELEEETDLQEELDNPE